MKKMLYIIILAIFPFYSNAEMLDLKVASMQYDGRSTWGGAFKWAGFKKTNGFVFGVSGEAYSFEFKQKIEEERVINQITVKDSYIVTESNYFFLPLYANIDLLLQTKTFDQNIVLQISAGVGYGLLFYDFNDYSKYYTDGKPNVPAREMTKPEIVSESLGGLSWQISAGVAVDVFGDKVMPTFEFYYRNSLMSARLAGSQEIEKNLSSLGIRFGLKLLI